MVARLPKKLWFAALLLGTAAITAGSAAYFDPEELAPFVIEKLPLANEELYLLALQVHVVAAALAMPGCLLLMTSWVLRRAPRLHRHLGRATGAAVLLALVPSGFYLAFFAKGGAFGTAGFLLTGGIIAAAMVQGIRTARAGRFAAHRRCTLHVVAQMSVAVTSRAMLFALDAANVDPDAGYLAALWIPVLGSAAAVELFVNKPALFPWRNHAPPADARRAVDVYPVPREQPARA